MVPRNQAGLQDCHLHKGRRGNRIVGSNIFNDASDSARWGVASSSNEQSEAGARKHPDTIKYGTSGRPVPHGAVTGMKGIL